MQRRTFSIGAGLALGGQWQLSAHSQDKAPTLTIVVPYAAGGIADIVARLFAQSMASTLGRPVVIDNKPGASGAIGAKVVQRARPDGNTLLIASQSNMQNPGLVPGFDFDPVGDFVAVSKLTRSPYVFMVSKDVPARTVAEFIAWGKTQPEVFWGSASSGGAPEVVQRAFQRHTGVKTTLVLYKGNSDIVTALIGGQVHMTMTPSSAVFDGAVQAGHIRYLAVTGRDPSPFYPQLQPLRTFVPGIPPNEQWLSFFAPKGTPAAVVAQLDRAAAKAAHDPAVQQALAKNNFEVNYQDSTEFTEYIKKGRAEWKQQVIAAGMRLEE